MADSSEKVQLARKCYNISLQSWQNGDTRRRRLVWPRSLKDFTKRQLLTSSCKIWKQAKSMKRQRTRVQIKIQGVFFLKCRFLVKNQCFGSERAFEVRFGSKSLWQIICGSEIVISAIFLTFLQNHSVKLLLLLKIQPTPAETPEPRLPQHPKRLSVNTPRNRWPTRKG